MSHKRQPYIYRHLHFISLACILVFGIFSLYLLQGNKQLQLTSGIITSCAYIAWGYIHHFIKGDLYPKVVIEYLLIGILAVTILYTFTAF